MPEITMPSGMKGSFRILKLRDQDDLAQAVRPNTPKKLKDTVTERLLKECWSYTEGPGPYAAKISQPEILPVEDLLSGDRMAYLLKLRNETWGSVVTVKVRCPCGEKIEQGIDLSELTMHSYPQETLDAYINDTELSAVLPLSERTVWWKPLTGHMERGIVKIHKTSPGSMATEALAVRITRISGFDPETRLDEETNEDLHGWLKEMDVPDADALREAMTESEGEIETLVEIPCPDCYQDVLVDVKDATDFFGPSRNRRKRKG